MIVCRSGSSGTWSETKARWKREGLSDIDTAGGGSGPQLREMDSEWEPGLWTAHGLANPFPLGDGDRELLEETESYRVERDSLGAVRRIGKLGSSIPQTLEYPLKPTWESWARFKRFLDPHDPRRRPSDWRDKAAILNQRSRVATFLAGSLFGLPVEWMGVEAWSLPRLRRPQAAWRDLGRPGFLLSPSLRAVAARDGL